MSKKSRRRNKKILGALAAGLGAMALMRGNRGTAAADVDSGRGGDSSSALARVKANTGVTGTKYPGENKAAVVASTPKQVVSRSRNKVIYSDGSVDTPGTIYRRNQLTAGNSVPPSMRGGAETAQGFVRKVPIGVRTRGGRGAMDYGWTTQPYKSGGRVGVGKAKRGFGRALKKGRK